MPRTWVERLPKGLRQWSAQLCSYYAQVGYRLKTTSTVTVKQDLLNLVPSWKHLQLTLIAATLLLFISVLALLMSHWHHQSKLQELLIDANRDYGLLPFDMFDAERYCRLTLERRFGEELGQNYIDQHSSRLDPKTGLYKIFMFAQIGVEKQQEPEAVHCFVDPERRVMTHFRTINLKKDSLMSRATKLFK